MFIIVWSTVIFFSGKILARSKANTDFGRAQIISRHIYITPSITQGLVLLFLSSLCHSTHKSNMAGMLTLRFPVFRSFPQKFGYLQWPWQKTSLKASLPLSLYSTSHLHIPHSNPLQYVLTSASSYDVRPIWLTLYMLLQDWLLITVGGWAVLIASSVSNW